MKDKTMDDKLTYIPMIIYKITPSEDWDYWLCMDTTSLKPTNQNSIKVPIFELTIKI